MSNATLEAIKSRCFVDEEDLDSCWIWRFATTREGYPIFKPAGHGCTLVRRFVFKLTGKPLAPHQPIVCKHGDKLCCNPAHLKTTTTKAISIKVAKTGCNSGLARRAKIAATKRATGKLTMDKAREIRSSAGTCQVVAELYGVDPSLVSRIRRGLAWVDFKNPYLALMT